jgi:hypothetical protein
LWSAVAQPFGWWCILCSSSWIQYRSCWYESRGLDLSISIVAHRIPRRRRVDGDVLVKGGRWKEGWWIRKRW